MRRFLLEILIALAITTVAHYPTLDLPLGSNDRLRLASGSDTDAERVPLEEPPKAVGSIKELFAAPLAPRSMWPYYLLWVEDSLTEGEDRGVLAVGFVLLAFAAVLWSRVVRRFLLVTVGFERQREANIAAGLMVVLVPLLPFTGDALLGPGGHVWILESMVVAAVLRLSLVRRVGFIAAVVALCTLQNAFGLLAVSLWSLRRVSTLPSPAFRPAAIPPWATSLAASVLCVGGFVLRQPLKSLRARDLSEIDLSTGGRIGRLFLQGFAPRPPGSGLEVLIAVIAASAIVALALTLAFRLRRSDSDLVAIPVALLAMSVAACSASGPALSSGLDSRIYILIQVALAWLMALAVAMTSRAMRFCASIAIVVWIAASSLFNGSVRETARAETNVAELARLSAAITAQFDGARYVTVADVPMMKLRANSENYIAAENERRYAYDHDRYDDCTFVRVLVEKPSRSWGDLLYPAGKYLLMRVRTHSGTTERFSLSTLFRREPDNLDRTLRPEPAPGPLLAATTAVANAVASFCWTLEDYNPISRDSFCFYGLVQSKCNEDLAADLERIPISADEVVSALRQDGKIEFAWLPGPESPPVRFIESLKKTPGDSRLWWTIGLYRDDPAKPLLVGERFLSHPSPRRR